VDDESVILDELVNFLIAARDTTSALLTFLTYALTLHPDIMALVRGEVLSRCGTDRVPTFHDIKQMKLLRACIYETLRLFPPVPVNERGSVDSCVFTPPAGDPPLFIPAGTPLIFSTLLIHRRKDLWGDDAEAFNPHRWIDGPERSTNVNSAKFFPFNSGPRLCLGQQLAVNEASFLMIRLLQTFDRFTLAQDEAAPEDSIPPSHWKTGSGRRAYEKVWPQTAFTLYSKGGMWVKMSSATH